MFFNQVYTGHHHNNNVNLNRCFGKGYYTLDKQSIKIHENKSRNRYMQEAKLLERDDNSVRKKVFGSDKLKNIHTQLLKLLIIDPSLALPTSCLFLNYPLTVSFSHPLLLPLAFCLHRVANHHLGAQLKSLSHLEWKSLYVLLRLLA